MLLFELFVFNSKWNDSIDSQDIKYNSDLLTFE